MTAVMHNLLWHRLPDSESAEIFWPWEQHHETRLALDAHAARCERCLLEVRPIFDGVGERDMLTIGCPTGKMLITALRDAVPPKPPQQQPRSADAPRRKQTRPRARSR